MLYLSHNFAIFTYFGFWAPEETSSTPQIYLYKLYSALWNLMVLSLLAMKTINVFFFDSYSNLQEFALNMFFYPDYMCNYLKALNVLNKRNLFLKIQEIMFHGHCVCANAAETEIRTRYNKTCRCEYIMYNNEKNKKILYKNSLYILFFRTIHHICTFLLMFSIVESAVKPYFDGFNTLPLVNWNLQRISSAKVYWLTYLHQIIVTTQIGFLLASYDSLVAGCMLQICSQLEILQSRLQKIQYSQKNQQHELIIECVSHHCIIYRQVNFVIFIENNYLLLKKLILQTSQNNPRNLQCHLFATNCHNNAIRCH